MGRTVDRSAAPAKAIAGGDLRLRSRRDAERGVADDMFPFRASIITRVWVDVESLAFDAEK
jgi:hypothetical protein